MTYCRYASTIALVISASLQAQPIELERDPQSHSPARSPLAAWQAAHAYLGDNISIRRIAFAGHGMFVFHSTPGSEAIHSIFVHYQEGAYQTEDDGPREQMRCTAPGAAPSEIEPALTLLLASPAWHQHAPRLDSFFLECFEPRLHWRLMPVPEGGFQQGVGIPTYDLPFVVSTRDEPLQLERPD